MSPGPNLDRLAAVAVSSWDGLDGPFGAGARGYDVERAQAFAWRLSKPVWWILPVIELFLFVGSLGGTFLAYDIVR